VAVTSQSSHSCSDMLFLIITEENLETAESSVFIFKFSEIFKFCTTKNLLKKTCFQKREISFFLSCDGFVFLIVSALSCDLIWHFDCFNYNIVVQCAPPV